MDATTIAAFLTLVAVPFFFCLTDVVIRCASFVCITVFVALSLPLSWSVSTQQDGGSGSMFDKAIIIGLIIIVLAFATFSFCTSLFLHYKSFRGFSFAHLKKTNLAIEALCSPFSSLPAARTGSNAMLLKNVIESTVIFFMMAVAGLAMADITANSATGNTGKSSEEIRDLEVASELATSAAILALTFLLTLRPGFYWLMLKQQERLTRQRLRLAAKNKLLASVQPLHVRPSRRGACDSNVDWSTNGSGPHCVGPETLIHPGFDLCNLGVEGRCHRLLNDLTRH